MVVVKVSSSAGAWASSSVFSPVSSSRNISPTPSETMIEGMIRLATTM